jgi:hypothetical protein
MKTVRVVGRFLHEDGSPVTGQIFFLPSRLWVNQGDTAYATLTVSQELDNGRFDAELTPTHGHDDPEWTYTVLCPVGKWEVEVADVEHPVLLKDLLPSRFQ